MSNYTITLKRISEVYSKSEVLQWFQDYSLDEYLTPTQYQTIADSGLWSKQKLASLIFDHYYLREIAFETPQMFKHYAKVKMQEIMFQYLPLIYTTCLEYNPLQNETFSITELVAKTKADSKNSTIEGSSSSTGQNASTSSSSSNGLVVNSDTPQGNVSKANILAGNYASSTQGNENQTAVTDNTSSNATGTSKTMEATQNAGNENETRTKTGFDLKMTKADLIANYRKNIYNVNQKIIEELNSLFFALF